MYFSLTFNFLPVQGQEKQKIGGGWKAASFAKELVMTFQGLILQQSKQITFPPTRRGILAKESVPTFKLQNAIGRNRTFFLSFKMINKHYLKPPHLNSVFHMVSLMRGFSSLLKKNIIMSLAMGPILQALVPQAKAIFLFPTVMGSCLTAPSQMHLPR